MTEYSKFLKHLGINKDLMLSDMQSRLPDCEKPVLLKRCKDFESCEIEALQKCCGNCNGILYGGRRAEKCRHCMDSKELSEWEIKEK